MNEWLNAVDMQRKAKIKSERKLYEFGMLMENQIVVVVVRQHHVCSCLMKLLYSRFPANAHFNVSRRSADQISILQTN